MSALPLDHVDLVARAHRRPSPSSYYRTTKTRAVCEDSVRQLREKNTTLVGTPRADLAERVVAYLRSRHAHKWAESAAAELGVSASTIRKLEERGSAPSALLIGRMGHAYGPEFVAAIFPSWSWVLPHVREERQRLLEHRMHSDRAELNALLGGK